MTGERISHYKIIEKLGEGGMGVVYKAEDTRLKRIVALKFLPYSLTGDKEAKQRFIHEAQSASALQHNNICTLHDIDDSDDRGLFIVMDYYEGETLKEKIERGPLKLNTIVDIAIQVSMGLAKAHEKGIIHRDIKPSNIFVTNDGTVKIIDFGLAKLTGSTLLTREGTTPGTINFMPPEQIRGEEINNRADIWALGVVIYQMITGQQPFKGDYEQAVSYSILNENPEPVTGIRTGVPMELERILVKMLEKDPDERYQHIDDALADIKKVKKEIEGEKTGHITNTNSGAGSEVPKTPGNKKKLIIIVSTGVIILAVILLLFNPFTPDTPKSQLPDAPITSLAVMYFENIPDPADKEHTGEMLTNLLITSLSRINGLEVISRERLLDIQKDLGHSDAKELSPELASKVAVRAGVNTMLIGSILQEKPYFAVTARLINVETGKITGSEQVKNFPHDQIFNLVDTLTFLLQSDFQSAEGSTGKIKPIAEVTTGSEGAYRAYVQGLDLISKLNYNEAAEAFKRAIELDENFAMAYFYLGFVQIEKGMLKDGTETFNKAASLANNVTERERLQILAFDNFRPDRKDKVEELLDKLKERYPYEIFPYTMYNYLCNNYLLNPEKAVRNCMLGLKYNPKAKMIWNFLAYSYAHLNQKKEAIAASKQYINLVPAEPNPYDTKGDIFAWFAEYDSSRQAYLKAVSLRRDFASAFKLGFIELLKQNYRDASEYFQMSGYKIPVIDIYQGELDRAQRKMLLNDSFNSRIHLYYELHKYPEMLKLAEEYSGKLKNYPAEIIYGRDYIAWAMIKNGRMSDAYKLLNDIMKDASGTTSRVEFISFYNSAILLYEEGKYESAQKIFEKVFLMLPVNHEPNFFYAVSLFKSGHLSKSIEELQKLINWPNEIFIVKEIPGAQGYWPIQAVKSHYWLARAYEQQGYIEKAIEEYRKFIGIWEGADFESPELKDARSRIEE